MNPSHFHRGLPSRHHRPVGMDGDVGAVVVEDGAGAVDDFLVALDLRHDLLLHLQRRQGNFDASSNFAAIMLSECPTPAIATVLGPCSI